MTLLETLRLYPPIAHLVRETVTDDEIVGEPVKARSQIWVSPWLTHRHRLEKPKAAKQFCAGRQGSTLHRASRDETTTYISF
jgi:cytochrome P450